MRDQEKEIKRLRKIYEEAQDPIAMKKILNEETYKRVAEGAKLNTKINSYVITVKEDNTRQYFVDGISENNAISNYHQDQEDGVEYMSNGMDDCMETIVEVEKCGTNIKRNKEGKIISSDELTKENREHNKSIGQPTDLKQWRSWWGKKGKDFKKLIKFNVEKEKIL